MRVDLRSAMLALAVVLAASVTLDWEIVLPDGGTACVTGRPSPEATCRATQDAALAGRLLGLPPGTVVGCRPRPGCRDARSLCIPGYRSQRPEGYC